MKGILHDHNLQGHLRILVGHLEGDEWREVWHSLNLAVYTLADLGLRPAVEDSIIWQVCQKEQICLITGNRNKAGPDSLEATIQQFNSLDSLPVFTVGDPDAFITKRNYAASVVAKLLEYLIDIDKYRGTGRLYLP